MALAPNERELEPLSLEELEAIAVFPLPRVVLLPGGVLPLHLFEPRYRAMMQDCIDHGPRAIAMAMLQPGWERDYERSPAIRPIAGVGRIVAHRKNPDGTFDLVLRGLCRARLEERTDLDRAYRVARATLLDDEDGEDEPALRRAIEPVLATASSLAMLERASGRGTADPLEVTGPAGRVVDRLADRWVHDAATRQTILETASVPGRVARVSDALVTLLAQLSSPSPSGGSTPPSN
ncbi:MAG: LON peptidase substrate-binding domain-containing protein [Myxococcota bacterium]|nr:LON peptidase substrate-binding domain-containing protein [Myxococcota bacterium]